MWRLGSQGLNKIQNEALPLSLPSPCPLSLFPLPLPLNLLLRFLADPPSNAHEQQEEDNWRSNKEHAIAKMEEEETEARVVDASGGGIDVFGRSCSSPATLESQVRGSAGLLSSA